MLLKHHLSSIAVCEEIKPEIFNINRDKPTRLPAGLAIFVSA